MTWISEFWHHYRRNVSAVMGLFVLTMIVVVAVLAGVIRPGDPLDLVASPFVLPGHDSAFPLGTDMLGRDVLSGIVHGSRVSLLIGIVATVVALLIGTTIGALAGFHGGWIDEALTRVTEIFQTIPSFLLLIVIVGIFQPSIETIVLGIGIVSWPELSRLVRAEFITLRGREFVQAGIALGMSDLRIIVTQILPNAAAPIIVSASLIVARAILNESALAFLGLGDPNVVSWGSMISVGREVVRTASYLTLFPGVAIVLTVLAFNLVGDGLNDAFNPRRRLR
jgi:peptide/nickel transport system permease protein